MFTPQWVLADSLTGGKVVGASDICVLGFGLTASTASRFDRRAVVAVALQNGPAHPARECRLGASGTPASDIFVERCMPEIVLPA